jgi:DNA topoisomerase-1
VGALEEIFVVSQETEDGIADFVSLRPLPLKGGAGSGNFNHEGRPGERGGSGPGGMSRDKDGTYRDATGKPVGKADQERLNALKLPPAWTNVQLSADPHAALQATGVDAKGRTQRVYSAEHSERMAGEKFSRLKDFTAAMPKLQSRIKGDLDSPDADQRTREAAAALYLIERTGFRVGSDRETGADKQAFGATTLRSEHVKVDGDKVSFSFVGKKGVDIEKTITDGRLARLLAPRVAAGGRLFNTSDSQVRDYLHSIDGDFKVKDFRTYIGTTTALKEISRMPVAKDEKEFARLQLAVSKKVSETLGNTPTVAKASYIDPAVWGRLRKR